MGVIGLTPILSIFVSLNASVNATSTPGSRGDDLRGQFRRNSLGQNIGYQAIKLPSRTMQTDIRDHFSWKCSAELHWLEISLSTLSPKVCPQDDACIIHAGDIKLSGDVEIALLLSTWHGSYHEITLAVRPNRKI